MMRFKIGALVGLAVGWAVGSGWAAETWQRLRSRQQIMAPGDVVSSGERPVVDFRAGSSAVGS